jgi:MoxR-like ATPase
MPTYIDFCDKTQAQGPTRDSSSDPLSSSARRGLNYVVKDPALSAAINAALILGRPLLLTGEPGTGKTTLADFIAWFMGLGDPLFFSTKSTSVARDLFYTYDAMSHMQASYLRSGTSEVLPTSSDAPTTARFIRMSALGLGNILPLEIDDLPLEVRSIHPGGDRRRQVVVIDEVDKANRDFPNDLLHEIEGNEFLIPELSGTPIKASEAPEKRPIVIITSNSEKNLPDAFLRRCVFHHIAFPDDATLREIVVRQVAMRLGDSSWAASSEAPFLTDCVKFFRELRKSFLMKQPATAELVDWVHLLAKFDAKPSDRLVDNPEPFQKSRGAIVKYVEDLRRVDDVWNSLTGKSQRSTPEAEAK